jgi:hypothetical protein
MTTEKTNLVFEGAAHGKIRVSAMGLDEAKTIFPNQALEVISVGKRVFVHAKLLATLTP